MTLLVALTIIVLMCTITAAFVQAAGFSEYVAPAERKAVWVVTLIILLALAAKWVSYPPMFP